MELAPKGLNEDIIRLISARKKEPDWLLAWRLEAFAGWKTMEEPHWARVDHPPIDYQDLHYFAAPKRRKGPSSLDEVDPELLRTYEKLGVPLKERAILAGVEAGESNVAVDAVFDSVSVATTFRATLAKAGVIFCPFSEAVQDYPDLVRRYLGAWCPGATTSSPRSTARCSPTASFVYIPKGVRCPMELSHLLPHQCREHRPVRADADHRRGGRYVSYLEGCTAPMRDENQLHAAVVELVALDNATIKYSTVQNWYPGDEDGQGRDLQLRHQARRVPWAQLARSLGPRWRPARPSRGSIPSLHPPGRQPASASSTPSP